MYTLKYCHAFDKIYKKYEKQLKPIRIACVFLKNEAFVVDINEDAWHILNNRPRKLEELCQQGVKQFSYSYSLDGDTLGYYALVLVENGDVYGWGKDSYKVISDENETDFYKLRRKEFKPHPKFKLQTSDIKIDRIAIGQRHCMAVTKSNELILWGDNGCGQLGSESEQDFKPYNVFEVEKVNYTEPPPKYFPQTTKRITDYVLETTVVTEKVQRCSLFCCLENISCILFFCYFFGACYKESFCTKEQSQDVQNRRAVFRDVPATPELMPARVKFNILRQVTDQNFEEEGHKIKQIACGSYHSLVLLTCGDLYGFGSNSSGQLGIIPEKSRKKPTLILKEVDQVVTTELHTLALTFDRRLFAMGDNSFAQLGSLKPSLSRIPIEIRVKYKFIEISTINGLSLGRDVNGNVYCWGYWGSESGKLQSDAIKKKDEREGTNENAEQSTSSNKADSSKIDAKKKVKESPNAVISEPKRVNCTSFAEIVARRFSITHYTISGGDNEEPDEEVKDLIDPEFVSVLKDDEEIEKEDLVKRVNVNYKEIDILKARVEVIDRRPNIQIGHLESFGPKIVGGVIVTGGNPDIKVSNSDIDVNG